MLARDNRPRYGRLSRGRLGLPVLPMSSVASVNRSQMVEIDRRTIEDCGISLIQMMENAGALLADLTRRLLGGSVEGRRIAVLAGRGHNGGGGLVAARRLHLMGAAVDVLLAAEPGRYTGVPEHQLQILVNLGMAPHLFEEGTLDQSDILLDTVIGYGLQGAVGGMSVDVIRAVNSAGRPVVSLDLPSGLDADSGEAFGVAVRASATLTLALPKKGLVRPSARPLVGRLFLADISVPPLTYGDLGFEGTNPFHKGPLVELA